MRRLRSPLASPAPSNGSLRTATRFGSDRAMKVHDTRCDRSLSSSGSTAGQLTRSTALHYSYTLLRGMKWGKGRLCDENQIPFSRYRCSLPIERPHKSRHRCLLHFSVKLSIAFQACVKSISWKVATAGREMSKGAVTAMDSGHVSDGRRSGAIRSEESDVM